jgi:hypothetical protein
MNDDENNYIIYQAVEKPDTLETKKFITVHYDFTRGSVCLISIVLLPVTFTIDIVQRTQTMAI